MLHRALPTRAWLARLLCCVGLTAVLSTVNAEAPRSGTVAGMRLGETPANTVEWLKAKYPQCDHQRSAYHALPGEATGPLAIVAINEGTMNVCPGTPEDKEAIDIIVVRFAHPSIAADRGAFEIHVDRRLPDPLLSSQKQIRYPLDKVLADLRRQYGRPTDEQRERVASTSANLAASLGVGGNVKREDRTIRLLWATKGKLPDDHGHGGGHGHGDYECDCGDRYVVAEIESTRSPATRPASRWYVTRVSLFTQHADVRSRQDVWDAQWLKQPPPAQPPSPPHRRPE